MGQGARPQPLVLRRSGWQRSPMGSSVLGIGLCSASDWEGEYSSCPPPTASSQGGPNLASWAGVLGVAPPPPPGGRAWWRVGRWPSSYCTGSSR